jgi:hypothetical protein
MHRTTTPRYRIASCREDGCPSPVWEDGLCVVHLRAAAAAVVKERGGARADYTYPIGPKPACTFPDCETVARSLGLCQKHYVAQRRERARPAVTPTGPACTFRRCGHERTAWGFLCEGHYEQLFAGRELRPLLAVEQPARPVGDGVDRQRRNAIQDLPSAA